MSSWVRLSRFIPPVYVSTYSICKLVYSILNILYVYTEIPIQYIYSILYIYIYGIYIYTVFIYIYIYGSFFISGIVAINLLFIRSTRRTASDQAISWHRVQNGCPWFFHSSFLLDSDPHSICGSGLKKQLDQGSEKQLDPDPQKMNADPQPWFSSCCPLWSVIVKTRDGRKYLAAHP